MLHVRVSRSTVYNALQMYECDLILNTFFTCRYSKFMKNNNEERGFEYIVRFCKKKYFNIFQ